MRICICTNIRPHQGGMVSYLDSIADGFRKLGHEVEIVTLFGVSEYCPIKNKLVKVSGLLLSKSELITLLTYLASKIILFCILFYNYWRRKYNLIYAPDCSAVNISHWLQKIYKVPIVHSAHSSLVKDLITQQKISQNSWVYKYFLNQEKKACQAANLIIANSLYTKKYIQSISNGRHSPIEISRNLINEDIFYPAKERADNQKFILLFVGRLVKRKGPHYPLLALVELLKQDKDYCLIYVGEGEEKQKLIEIIKKNNLKDNVKILGNLPYKKIGKLYRLADLVLVPSVVYQGLAEPLGIIALEAMASGVPVIASKIGGLKEIIKDKFNGLLVPEKDVAALVRAIKLLKHDLSLKNKLIKNGLEQINQEYTRSKVAQKQINIFLKYISN